LSGSQAAAQSVSYRAAYSEVTEGRERVRGYGEKEGAFRKT